ncbi:MAG: type II secretion system F family protein [Candidatus Latescibacteria bacterium]|jgi:tight adherence protein C|nr:type II secretion system F family protein [Candidatus Latescibacterota bacterium]
MNPATIILLLVLVAVIIAAILIYVGSRVPRQDEDPLEARLAEFSQRGENVTLEQIEMSQSFQERVIYPILRQFGDLAARFTPQNAIQDINQKLERSGKAGWIDASMFLALRFVAAGIAAGLAFLVFTVSAVKQPLSTAILYSLIALVIGFFFPQLWLNEQIKKRQQEVQKALPDALDLLTICVEAGLGFDAAMSNVAQKWDNELSLAFARCIRETQLGKIRRDAMRDMADRIDLSDLTSFVAAVVQSEQLGVSMAKILRIQADQMRMRRRQIAEEKAQQAPIKMLIPMVAFIFPTIFIVLLTPAILRIMKIEIFR